ncbi:ABC transporter substrate-binding protein [Microbacterium suaedae]|uniref:ABC transporter substrate-binding protein n=1 Tax=Microbacterium suaedae TaxID=2067813 RepID=UPI000DA1DD40|nr:ABC transporter substrate-binding protein [Microbacterium suaedae]
MTSTHTRNGFAALALTAAVALTGCSSATSDTSAEPADSAAAEAAFPVTVEHEFGSTIVEEEPQRVVSIGWGDFDNLLALGIVPVGRFGSFSEEPTPWEAEMLGDEETEFLGYTTELDYEKIASLDPDLIIAVQGTSVDEESYAILEDIAPTVARPAGYGGWQVPRAEGTRQIAAAVGRDEAGEEMLEGLADRFAEVQSEHPELVGATGVSAITYDASLYYAFAPVDGRGAFLEELGLQLPAGLLDGYDGTSFTVELAPEEVGALDGDLVLFMADDPEYDPADDNALFERFGAEFVAVTGESRHAISINTPSSIAYALDELAPVLADAIGG